MDEKTGQVLVQVSEKYFRPTEVDLGVGVLSRWEFMASGGIKKMYHLLSHSLQKNLILQIKGGHFRGV